MGSLIDKRDILELVDDCRIRVYQWGGESFPYDIHYDSVEKVRLPQGVRYWDRRPWPHSEKSFFFWQMDDKIHFIQVNYLSEDQTVDWGGKKIAENKLGYEWALLDIVRPIHFAWNLINNQKKMGTIAVFFEWGGMTNRELVVLSRSRIGFYNEYKYSEPIWDHTVEINLDTDIYDTAMNTCLELFWLFGWDDVSATALNKDLKKLVDGYMI